MGVRIDPVFLQILHALASMYRKVELTEDMVKAYYMILGDLDRDLLKAATLEYGTTGKFFPTPAELRQTAFDLIDRAEGRLGPYEAWDQVMRKVGTHGVYRGEPEFEDPVVHHAIGGVGGWRAICLAPEDSLASTRARFVAAFQEHRRKEQAETRMLPEIREVVRRLTADQRPQLEEGDNGRRESAT